MTHPRVRKLLGTLREGSSIHEPPVELKAKGIMYIAAHPEETPQLITPWGIHPLSFIPTPEPQWPTVLSHTIQANPPK